MKLDKLLQIAGMSEELINESTQQKYSHKKNILNNDNCNCLHENLLKSNISSYETEKKFLREIINTTMSDNIDESINIGSIVDSVYRTGSMKYFKLIREARKLLKEGKTDWIGSIDRHYLENTDLGEIVIFEGTRVPLDFPMIVENKENQTLNKPSRSSGPKKYKVYVRNKNGNVIQVNFGDLKGGLTSKMQNDDARKSFVSRHNCEKKNDKTKPGYWSCRLPRFWKELGLKKNSYRFW
jgi:hypothetical protein